MSKVIEGQIAKPCLFDNSKECPARKALEDVKWSASSAVDKALEKACPICPIRLKMLPK